MSNSQYIEDQFCYAQRIYVDTATLMDDGMPCFISNNELLLLSLNRKMIICRAVYLELTRHLQGSNEQKKKDAMRAIGIISNYPDLFEVENEKYTSEELDGAFADAQLLSELIRFKGDCTQLLITNDRDLSKDAFRINQQESNKGKGIRVCFVNRFGHLNCCDCVKEFLNTKKTVKPFQNENDMNKNPDDYFIAKTKQKKRWGFDLLSAGIGLVVGSLVSFCVECLISALESNEQEDRA